MSVIEHSFLLIDMLAALIVYIYNCKPPDCAYVLLLEIQSNLLNRIVMENLKTPDDTLQIACMRMFLLIDCYLSEAPTFHDVCNLVFFFSIMPDCAPIFLLLPPHLKLSEDDKSSPLINIGAVKWLDELRIVRYKDAPGILLQIRKTAFIDELKLFGDQMELYGILFPLYCT